MRPPLVVLAAIVACQSPELSTLDSASIDLEDFDNDGFAVDEDCDDLDPERNPAQEEICDGIDQNCDGFSDEGLAVGWFLDGDADGLGHVDSEVYQCSPPGDVWILEGGDCDDSDPGVGMRYWYPDSDGDGFGDIEHDGVEGCLPPLDDWVEDDRDCDDGNADVHPEAEELAGDGIDNNCSGADAIPEPDGTYVEASCPEWLPVDQSGNVVEMIAVDGDGNEARYTITHGGGDVYEDMRVWTIRFSGDSLGAWGGDPFDTLLGVTCEPDGVHLVYAAQQPPGEVTTYDRPLIFSGEHDESMMEEGTLLDPNPTVAPFEVDHAWFQYQLNEDITIGGASFPMIKVLVETNQGPSVWGMMPGVGIVYGWSQNFEATAVAIIGK